jgi:dihydropteroate synthase
MPFVQLSPQRKDPISVMSVNEELYVFTLKGNRFDFLSRTHVMGILNVTPDSFSDGGSYMDVEAAVAHGEAMERDGADFIDIGGESSRPDADSVSLEEEIRRVVPVIERLARRVKVPLSVDTTKAEVADAAVRAGASIINDISGMSFDPLMPAVAARHGATVVVMHMRGSPKTMQQHPKYENVIREVYEFLSQQLKRAREYGIAQLIVDPGIGFGKNLEHNLDLMKGLETFSWLGCPILVGPSRKSFIGTLLDLPVDQRLEGTAAAVTACILRGAHIIRVHDVKEMKRVAVVADALKGSVTAV